MLPGQRDQLAASGTGDEGQPDERAPARVLLSRSICDLRRFLRRRWVRLRLRDAKSLSGVQRVDGDPAPTFRGAEGAAEHRVALATEETASGLQTCSAHRWSQV